MVFLDILFRIPTIFPIDLLPNSMKLCWMHFCLSDLMTPCPGEHNGANSEINIFETFRLEMYIRMFRKYPRIIENNVRIHKSFNLCLCFVAQNYSNLVLCSLQSSHSKHLSSHYRCSIPNRGAEIRVFGNPMR